MEALRRSLETIIDGPQIGAEFYLLLEAGGQIKIRRADIDHEAQEELAQAFVASVRDRLWQDGLSLHSIAGADDRSSAIYEYDLDTVPPRLEALEKVLVDDSFPTFDNRYDQLRDLKAIVVLVGHGEQQLALYRHHYPFELLRPSGTFSLISRGTGNQRFERLADDVLRINASFQFFKIGTRYYILDLKVLERYFGFHDAIRNVATKGLANIKRTGLVEDTTRLEEHLDDITFARKLVRAATSSPVLAQIPNDQIIAFVRTHPALKGAIPITEDGTQLRLGTKKARDMFLQLLNDDFLQSQLTNRYYASLAKDTIEIGA